MSRAEMDQACPLCQVDNINSSNSHFAFLFEILYSEFLFLFCCCCGGLLLKKQFSINHLIVHVLMRKAWHRDRILVYPFYETNTLTLYSGIIILFCTSLFSASPSPPANVRSITPSLPVINSSASSSTPTQFEKLVNNVLKF